MTFDFFESDPSATQLMFREGLAIGGGHEKQLYRIYEGYIEEVESMIVRLQHKQIVRSGPSRLIAFSVAALVGQLAHRRTKGPRWNYLNGFSPIV